MPSVPGPRIRVFVGVGSNVERVAAICPEDGRVRRVDVVVEKPGSLRFARSAAVEITREAPG